MFTISLGQLINDISHCWCIKKRRINSSRERALIFFRSNSLENASSIAKNVVSPWRSTLLCWRRPERLVALIKNPPPISLVPKSPNAITRGLGNISVIKIPSSLSHSLSLSLFLSLSLANRGTSFSLHRRWLLRANDSCLSCKQRVSREGRRDVGGSDARRR